jgi:hypothetical protein
MITSLNSVNQLIFVMVKCGVLFEVRTEFSNIIQTSFSFKGLSILCLPDVKKHNMSPLQRSTDFSL